MSLLHLSLKNSLCYLGIQLQQPVGLSIYNNDAGLSKKMSFSQNVSILAPGEVYKSSIKDLFQEMLDEEFEKLLIPLK